MSPDANYLAMRTEVGDGAALQESMRRYYRQRAPEYDQWYERVGRYDDPATNAQWAAELAELESWVRGFGEGHVLELAPGTGKWTEMLAAAPAVIGVTALDFAPEMLALTAMRTAGSPKPVRLVRGDAYRLPFAAGRFDSGFFGFWFSHVAPEALAPFLAGVRRVVQPGAPVMMVDSLTPPPEQGEAAASGNGRGQLVVQSRPLNNGSRHEVLKVYYTAESLARTLEAAGAGAVIEARQTARFFVAARYRV